MGRGLEEHKVIKQNKELRCGFTTGSCAVSYTHLDVYKRQY